MIAIFSHHLWMGISKPDAKSLLESGLNTFFHELALGVVFFNILSGFLLSLPYLGEAKKPLPGYSEFLRKRFLRIIPQYYLAALLTIIGNIVIYNSDIYSSAASLPRLFLFLQSWQSSIFFTNYAAFWYLGLLAQFYFFFPFCLRLFRRLGARKAFILLAACSYGGCGLLEIYVAAVPDSILGGFAYMLPFNLPSRLPEFALGMWFASVWRPDSGIGRHVPGNSGFLKFLGFLLIFAVVAAVSVQNPPFPVSLMAQVSWCFLIFVALFVWHKSSDWGSRRLVKSFAAASYGFYLLHQPMLSYVKLLGLDRLGPMGEFVLTSVIMIPIIFGCSILLERVSNRILDRYSR